MARSLRWGERAPAGSRLPSCGLGARAMGIFDALTTAVTGLQAQSFALQNISGNIANSQTTAFKRTDTRFEDLVNGDDPRIQVSGNVVASSRSTNSVQG